MCVFVCVCVWGGVVGMCVGVWVGLNAALLDCFDKLDVLVWALFYSLFTAKQCWKQMYGTPTVLVVLLSVIKSNSSCET